MRHQFPHPYMFYALMKVILFNDKQNSDQSLKFLNSARNEKDKRFWKIDDFHQLVFKKVKELLHDKTNNLEIVRTYVYTGEYTPEAINKLEKSCGDTIREMNILISQEEALLNKINRCLDSEDVKKEVSIHVRGVKQIFEGIKQEKIKAIGDQVRRAKAQPSFFEFLNNNKFIQLRTTPLNCRNGYIQQKGIDVKLTTDLLKLAYSHAYDVAVILSGDADLAESLRVIKDDLGKIVILFAYFNSGNKRNSTISEDLISYSDRFVNIKDFSEDDILSISEQRRSADGT